MFRLFFVRRAVARALPTTLPTAGFAAWICTALCALLLLPGCSLLSPQATQAAQAEKNTATVVSAPKDEKDAQATDASVRDAFKVEIQAPPDISDYLRRHLELQRFRQLSDLSASELSRLLAAAEANTRELLATQGYFSPTLRLELQETRDDAQAQHSITLSIEPGPQTRIGAVEIDFSGPILSDPATEAQRANIRQSWGLRPGQPFSQTAWDRAKLEGQRQLSRLRFPQASLEHSLADVDADAAEAKLSLAYASGPLFRFGPIQAEHTDRYGTQTLRRLARLPTGADYDEAQLLEAQQRLTSSGYYDSAFLAIDPNAPDPLNAAVIAQVREAQFQRMVFGIGLSTDSGPRISIDHSHNHLPTAGWRALSNISYDNQTSALGSDWLSLPNEDGWRWLTGAQVRREPLGSYDVNSGRLRAGRSQAPNPRFERSHILQLDYANNQGQHAPPSASALGFNWGWTGRYFDSLLAPSSGMGLAAEVGPGITLGDERHPFVRAYARWLGFVPLATVRAASGSSRKSRLALRAEAGAVLAKDSAQVPATLMFLTGGDTTVRGYGFRDIGAHTENGQVEAGRYLGSGSIEWQHPIVINGEISDFESSVFVDAGVVTDKISATSAKVGLGVGGRWRSPIGAVQMDLAYGLAVERFRFHLRIGFSF